MSNITEELKFECGWWLPKSEMHLPQMMRRINCINKGRYSYQRAKLIAILSFMPDNKRKTVIDIGSNIGSWTYSLVDFFDFVHCFEPIKIHQDCWVKNLEGYSNVKLYPVALGDEDEQVKMFVPDVCMAGAYITSPKNHATDKPTEIYKNGTVIESITVKSLDNYNFESIDFIKIDVEGYELNVLKGAKETILRNKPCILLEQKADNLYGVEFLEELGMSKMFSFDGDYFMGWCKLNEEEHTKSIRKMFGNSKMGLRIR